MVKPVVVVLASLALLAPWQDSPQQLELESLKKLIEQMGYETEQQEGASNFEFLTQRDELDIPISAEVSESRNFVWLTVFLGDPPADAERLRALLNDNYKIQPSQFYITDSGRLMCALPMENRGLQSEWIRKMIDKLADDVAKTEADWGGGDSP